MAIDVYLFRIYFSVILKLGVLLLYKVQALVSWNVLSTIFFGGVSDKELCSMVVVIIIMIFL